MIFDNIEFKREDSFKLVDVFIDENLAWNNHIEVIEKKISKNTGIPYRASYLFYFKNLRKIYFSFTDIFITNANIAWANTFKTKLHGILKKQKHAGRIIFHTNRVGYSRPLIKEMKALNAYQINIIQTLKFIRKPKYGINPWIFLSKFLEVDLQYPTRFSQSSF